MAMPERINAMTINKKQTSNRVASVAGRALPKSSTPKSVKPAVASALAQAHLKKGKK